MDQQQLYRLKDDIRSHVKHSHVYALCNDMVKLVADHGSVFLVETEKGTRFPVPAGKIDINLAQADTPTETVIQKIPARAKKTTKQTIQPSLF